MVVSTNETGPAARDLANDILNRQDATLRCSTCRSFTRHSFVDRVKVSMHVFDVMYECHVCGTHRVWGRETDKKIVDDEDED